VLELIRQKGTILVVIGLLLIAIASLLHFACLWQLRLYYQNAVGKQKEVIVNHALRMKASEHWLFISALDLNADLTEESDSPSPDLASFKSGNQVELYWRRIEGCKEGIQVFTSKLSPVEVKALENYRVKISKMENSKEFADLINGEDVLVSPADEGFQFFIIERGLVVSISERDYSKAKGIVAEIL
jgi:hypothetical protein